MPAERQPVGLLLLLLLLAPAALGVSADTTHPHSGSLQAYAGAPPRVVLDAADLARVLGGVPVHTHLDHSGVRRSVAVFRVQAPSAAVWSVIGNFDAYPEWIDAVRETEVYERRGEEVYVRFRVRLGLSEIQYNVHHSYPADRLGWGTWKLDHRRPSDLEDSVGFWRVDPVPDEPGASVVTYSATVRWRGWLSSIFASAISSHGLESVTEWVRKESEKLGTGRH